MNAVVFAVADTGLTIYAQDGETLTIPVSQEVNNLIDAVDPFWNIIRMWIRRGESVLVAVDQKLSRDIMLLVAGCILGASWMQSDISMGCTLNLSELPTENRREAIIQEYMRLGITK